jgi:hypothetical protein
MNIEDLENYDFLLRIDSGAVAPKDSSLKNLYLEINNSTTVICNIKGINYDISNDTMIRIKDFIKANINFIVGYSIQEDSEYLRNANSSFGNNKFIFIKYGLLNVSLNGNNADQIGEFLTNFIDNIIMIIKGEK